MNICPEFIGEWQQLSYQFSSIDQNMDGLLALLFQCTCFEDGALCQAALQFARQTLAFVKCVYGPAFLIAILDNVGGWWNTRMSEIEKREEA